MRKSKTKPFFQKIDAEILYRWKDSITQNEKIKDRLEEALLDNIEKHKKTKDL